MDVNGQSDETQERITRGAQAASLISGGVFLGAVVAVSARYAAEARDAKTKDDAWEAVLRARALSDVMTHLRAQMADGHAAEAALPEIEPVVDVRTPHSYSQDANAARHEFMARLRANAEQEAASRLTPEEVTNG